jgi:hypothetical protein
MTGVEGSGFRVQPSRWPEKRPVKSKKKLPYDPQRYFRLWERFSTAIYSVWHIHYKCSFIRAPLLAASFQSNRKRNFGLVLS